MGKLIEAKIGEYRYAQKYALNDLDCSRDDIVIVEEDGHHEFGTVVSDVERVCAGKTEGAKGKIVRKVTEGDLKQIEFNRQKSRDALQTCLRKITETRLEMQLIKAEIVFDTSKIIFFFTAEGRVDFRNLVKELARIFRVRIELKQIGVRDRAKVIGGWGVCGRELCCSSHLKDFGQLTIKMAKTQGLPLNPTRISGVCGRIKCCMAYEFEVYRESSRGLPKVGQRLKMDDGEGRVANVDILKRTVSVDLGDGKIIRQEFPAKVSDKKSGVAVMDAPEAKEESGLDIVGEKFD
ncbi:MAG: stage 0 sporulation protein [Candidatus Omnitrophica bacterium CG12_big_fil_rev_8_21_14_0_65_50_5]|nr:MAG: stage 0 sporulation protein [Candidatus Omnitrophica bacterium CG12_big_fil_rev_8_21_14_0_65_50_5]